jgi:hypothetical protein
MAKKFKMRSKLDSASDRPQIVPRSPGFVPTPLTKPVPNPNPGGKLEGISTKFKQTF